MKQISVQERQVRTIFRFNTKKGSKQDKKSNQGLSVFDIDMVNYQYNSINDLFNFIAEGSFQNKKSKKPKHEKINANEFNYNKNTYHETNTNQSSIESNKDMNAFKTEIETYSIMNDSSIDKIKPLITDRWLDEINAISSGLSYKINNIDLNY